MESTVGPHSKKKICYYYDGWFAFCIFYGICRTVRSCGFGRYSYYVFSVLIFKMLISSFDSMREFSVFCIFEADM